MKRRFILAILASALAGAVGCAEKSGTSIEPQSSVSNQVQDNSQDDTVSRALPPKQIVFADKSGTVTDTHHLSGYASEKIYAVSVHAGKILTAKQINIEEGKRISLQIFDPNGENVSDLSASCNSHLTAPVTVTGDYKIIVSECLKADSWTGSYTLEITAQ